jgi:NAD(P)-dependent dehydrogenase (short-subunit alcohol dehydrogenase family)
LLIAVITEVSVVRAKGGNPLRSTLYLPTSSTAIYWASAAPPPLPNNKIFPPLFRQSNYAAAKAGIMGFTKSLARDLGSRGFTVNAVATGFIQTDMTDALPEEQKEVLTAQIPRDRLGSR